MSAGLEHSGSGHLHGNVALIKVAKPIVDHMERESVTHIIIFSFSILTPNLFHDIKSFLPEGYSSKRVHIPLKHSNTSPLEITEPYQQASQPLP